MKFGRTYNKGQNEVFIRDNEDGSIDGQCLDYGQMTPVLTAAIKGLIDKVETLEAENTDLKNLIKNSSSFANLKSSL